MVSDNIRRVRFMCEQGAEDLYRCIDNGRVYVRQPCDDDYAYWLTSNKWQGGYEADCPMREGLTIRVVDKDEKTLFEEEIRSFPGICYPCAIKKGPFCDEALRELASRIEKLFGLASYEEWSKWLMADAEKCGFAGYADTWRFCEVEHDPKKKLEKLSFLGKTAYATSEKTKHRICGKEWTTYEIMDEKMEVVLALCGYRFE